MYLTRWPENNTDARKIIFNGSIYLLPPSTASRKLVSLIGSEICKVCGIAGKNLEDVHCNIPDNKLYAHLAPVRHWLRHEISVAKSIQTLLSTLGFDGCALACDYPRLRVVLPQSSGQLMPEAAYTVHRDTWYANPQTQINCWIPLHNVNAEQGFDFYPDFWGNPIQNTSERFDFGNWINRVGWQETNGVGKIEDYPSSFELPTRAVSFETCKAALLIFSAHHLHATRPNGSNRARLSIDFRFMHRGDKFPEMGAPNIDNASKGEASRTYNYLDHINAEVTT